MDDQPLLIADAEGVIRFWSPGATLAFGHAADTAVGRTLDVIVPPDHRPAHWAGFRRAMASGAAAVEGQVTPFPVLCANGCIRERVGRVVLVRDTRGQAIGAMVVFA